MQFSPFNMNLIVLFILYDIKENKLFKNIQSSFKHNIINSNLFLADVLKIYLNTTLNSSPENQLDERTDG